MAQETLTPGYFYMPSKRSRKGNLADFLSVVAFEAGCVLNRDGSLAIGFELSLPQEESLESLETLIHECSAAAKALPIGTALQKLDVYWEATSTISIPEASSFFHRKTLEHQEGKPIIKHRSWLFLRFFNQAYTPATTWRPNPDPWQEASWKQKTAQAACAAFLEAMPSTLGVRRLSQAEQEQLLFQYISLTFHRPTQGFERAMVRLPDRLAMGLSLKGVTMTGQAEEVTYNRQNNLGLEGVSSPFLWPVTHLARFPHIVCQHIELIDDKQWRKHKNLAFDFSAQLQIQARPRALAIHRQEQLMALEKLLNERDTRLVKLHFSVLTWHTDTALLQKHTDQLKSALGKAGLEVTEAAEDTDTLFFANAPGATGFLEGCYMPLETAVAYMPFITPRRGDEQGIYLQDRHGTPIGYDPFKYQLDNQHVFLFGPSGSGKSFFNGKMIKDRYEAGHTVVVMDSGGTYRFLFQALAGTYIEYNPEQPLRLNPLLVKPKAGKYRPDTDKVAFLAHFLAKMWKGDLNKSPLSEVEYALLAKFLTAYYEGLQPGTIPHLADFCAWLQGHLQQEAVEKDLFDARNFFIVLAPFTQGIYKDHFNALEVEYLQDSKLLCFELEAVKSDRKLYPLVVQVLFDYILQLVATQPAQKKFIDIEEGWSMLDDASESYIEAFFRKGRKTNTAIRIITQNVTEIQQSSIAGAMKNNAATFILLYNDKVSVREDIAEFLGMDAFDMEKYASLRRRDSYLDGYREVLIKEMDHSAVWRVSLSLFEHALLTSRPDERLALQALVKKEGHIEQAVTTWVHQTLQATKQRYVC